MFNYSLPSLYYYERIVTILSPTPYISLLYPE